MRKKQIFLCVCLVLTAQATAALPPLYQSIREFKALLDSPQIADRIGSEEVIRSITRDDNGFSIQTTKQTVSVCVIYDPVDHPGPAKFHLEFENS